MNTTFVHTTAKAETHETQHRSHPYTGSLAAVYALSVVVAFLTTVASVMGLLNRQIFYPADDLVLSFVPSDAFNLAFGVPVLLGAMWLARRKVLAGFLCWPGALFYLVYMYIPYLLSVPFNVLSFLYLLIILLSTYTLILIVAKLDREDIHEKLSGVVPVRTCAGILIGLAVLITIRQAASMISVIITPVPVSSIELSAWIADFTVATPALLIVGILLLHRKDIGYATAPGMLLGYGMLALSVIPYFIAQARYAALPFDAAGLLVILVMAGLCFLPLGMIMRGAAAGVSHLSLYNLNATRVIATTIGVFFGLFSGINHGLFEILQGNQPTGGLFIHAIGEAQRFWPLGSELAFTVIPNFLITGIASVAVGTIIVIWSLWFLPTRHGPTVFLALFILSFLVGGGIGQVFFFIPAWIFATQMDKPLNGWRRLLPTSAWPFLSRLWPVALVLATVVMSIGLEMAILGYFPGLTDPESIESTAMFFVLAAAVLYVVSFIAGLGHELRRMERHQTAIG